MKKIILGLMLLVVLSFVILGCQKQASAPVITKEPTTTTETSGTEETEISNNLNEIEDLDQIDAELEQDINVQDLENLTVE